MSDAAVLSNAQLNKRILSVIVFTFFCYLSVGLPLAVLPGFVHNQLGFSSFIAGLIISLQYFATLLSRPHSGRLADRYGPKRVVMMGLVCFGMSGVLSIIAALCSGAPLLSLTLLALGRLFLGVGESFSSTGSTLWGMNIVGPRQTARVISWNGVATYFAMAIGAPLGVLLNQGFGISGFAGLVALMGAIGFWMASGKPAVSVSAGVRIPFHRVVSRVWLFGLALGFGTIGFGVISTFITLYFASRDWSGAAFALTLFSLGFVLVRLACGRYITRFGGLKVSLISFVLEGVGLLLIAAIKANRSELGHLRRMLLRVQRLLAPEPAALFRLLNRPPNCLNREPLSELRIFTEEFSVALNDLASLMERIRLLQEEIAARLMEQSNRTLFLLTSITVLALPINIVAGFFGMNVGGIPLANNPHGFLLLVLVVLVFTLVAGWLALRRPHD